MTRSVREAVEVCLSPLHWDPYSCFVVGPEDISEQMSAAVGKLGK